MSVKVKTKPLKTGKKSVYLQIYHNGKVTHESLKVYLLPGKDPKTKAFNSNVMAEAQRIAAEREKEIIGGKVGIKQRKDIDLADRLDAKSKTGHCSACYVRRLFPGITLNEVTIATYIKLRDAMKADGLRSTSISNYLKVINAVLNEAVINDELDSNVWEKIPRKDKVHGKARERAHLDDYEMEAIRKLYLSDPQSDMVRDMYLLSCYTGLRLSDIKSLCRDDIDWSKNIIIKTMKKTQSEVRVPLCPQAIKILNKYSSREKYFINIPANVNVRLKTIAKAAGIDQHITFHTGRHTNACQLLNRGARLEVVSSLLGHKSLATTSIYAKIVDSSREEAVKLWEK